MDNYNKKQTNIDELISEINPLIIGFISEIRTRRRCDEIPIKTFDILNSNWYKNNCFCESRAEKALIKYLCSDKKLFEPNHKAMVLLRDQF